MSLNPSIRTSLWILLLLFATNLFADHPGNRILVEQLPDAISVDGVISDWPQSHEHQDGSDHHHNQLATLPSFVTSPDEMKYNKGWDPSPRVRAGVHQQTLYLLVEWNDESADTIYRPWKNMGHRWVKGRNKDDMFSIRFEMNGSLQACMLSDITYSVDLWRWTAGRSNNSGYADDMTHAFSTEFKENAAEYPYMGKTVYISTDIDSGNRGWQFTRKPPKGKSDIAVLPGIESVSPDGSLADVSASGKWKDGKWVLELSRPLATADPNDVVFKPGLTLNTQIAIFNAGYRLRKQITNPFLLDFSQIR